MSVEYQVQMVYRQEDVAALVKVLEFRRRPEKNLRLARKIGYPIFGLLLLGVGASIIVGIVTTGAFAPITIVTLVLSVLCILGGIALVQKFTGRALGGFTTVILILLFSSSVIMISLGIIGYYIARIYEEIKGRPRYIVAKECGAGKQEEPCGEAEKVL